MSEPLGFGAELLVYVGRVRQFQRNDWIVYLSWVGTMIGLVVGTGGFLAFGAVHGVHFPSAAWWVPLGSMLFSLSIAIDTIGHRSIYKPCIRRAEGLVHGITIACGVGSCVLLCAAYRNEGAWIPALTLTVLSIIYSLVDEVFHWHRYWTERSDRVEMWSHVGILTGHGVMMLGWWTWYFTGYQGVGATLSLL